MSRDNLPAKYVNPKEDENYYQVYSLGMPKEVADDYVPEEIDLEQYAKRQKQLIFLNSYMDSGGMVQQSAKNANVSRFTVRYWNDNDKLFNQAYQKAKEDLVELMEEEVIRRGMHGYLEPVYYKGEQRGQVRKYSDNLLMFRLKELKPSYKDSHQTNIGIAGEDITITFKEPEDQG